MNYLDFETTFPQFLLGFNIYNQQIDWAKKSVVAQNQVEMDLVSYNSTCNMCYSAIDRGPTVLITAAPGSITVIFKFDQETIQLFRVDCYNTFPHANHDQVMINC